MEQWKGKPFKAPNVSYNFQFAVKLKNEGVRICFFFFGICFVSLFISFHFIPSLYYTFFFLLLHFVFCRAKIFIIHVKNEIIYQQINEIVQLKLYFSPVFLFLLQMLYIVFYLWVMSLYSAKEDFPTCFNCLFMHYLPGGHSILLLLLAIANTLARCRGNFHIYNRLTNWAYFTNDALCDPECLGTIMLMFEYQIQEFQR